MITVKIKENSKEASALLEYLRSLSFVEIQEKPRYNATTEKVIKEAREGKGLIHTESHADLMEKLRT